MWFVLTPGYDGAVAVGESVCQPLRALTESIESDPSWQRWRTGHRLRVFDLSVDFSAHPRGDGLRVASSSWARGRFRVDLEGARVDLARMPPQDRVTVGWDVMRCALQALPPGPAADVPELPTPEQVWTTCREHGCFVTFEFDHATSTLQPCCSEGGYRLTEADVMSPRAG